MLLYIDPAPDALFSHPFRTESLRGIDRPGTPETYPVLEIESDTAGDLFLSTSGVAAPDAIYIPKVMEWGPIGLGVNVRSNDVAAMEVDVVIADAIDDGAGGKRIFDGIATGYANRFRGARATILLLGPSFNRANAAVLFRGVVDSFIKTGLAQWRIRLRTDDKALSYSEAPRIPYGRFFPRILSEVEGTFAALIYGKHRGAGLGGDGGAVTTVYVDTDLFRYAVGLGHYNVTGVYRQAGDEAGATFSVIDPSLYEVLYLTIAGKLFTVIEFTDNQNNEESENIEIRVDVEGFGSIEGDGFVGDWENPAWQLLHYLANFVFGDWRSGEYVDPSTLPLDLASFAASADYFDVFGYESSRLLREPTSCEGTINEWAASTSCKVFWTNEGKLAILPLDLRPPLDLYDSEFWARASEEAVGFDLPTDSAQIIERLVYSHAHLDSEGRYMRTGSVSDISVPEKVRITADLAWSRSAL